MVRGINQDRAGQFFTGNCGLYFVADGMGGHYAGEKASETIFAMFASWWDEYVIAPQRPGFPQAVEQIRDIIQQSNLKIRQITPPHEICGATLVLLWLTDKDYAVFSVGDSRCYLATRRGFLPHITQLTTDDVACGMGPGQDGKLLRALGADDHCLISMQTGQVPAKAVFALCSDGVYKACPEKTWMQLLRGALFGTSLQQTSVLVSQEVRRNGAPDNYSLVLVKP